MIKNNKVKIAIVFILFMMLMPIFLSGKTYAKMIDESYVENDPWGPQSISYNQLESLWELLCTDHKQHIPSQSNVKYAEDGDSSIDTTTLGDNESTYNLLLGHYYQSEELAYYAKIEDKICSPKAAYILNYIKENQGGYPCPVQVAWWTTRENVGNMHPSDNELARIGTAYQDFVQKVAKDKNGDIEDTSKYKPITHTFEDGKTVEIMFPETDVPSTIEFDTSKATVKFDEKRQKWIAGPYNIKYVDDSFNGIDFGLLDKFDIYTDASTEALKDYEWRFVFPKEKQDKEKRYPASKEPFYIEINYKEKITKITGIDVDYKYLVAGGKYQKLSGTYDKVAWSCTRTCTASTSCSTLGHVHHWSYKLNASKQNLDLKSQTLAVENMAARWYEIEKVSIRLNQSTLRIQKKALDENGNELSADEVKDRFGKNQYFDFKVKITHSDGRVENSVITVKAGSTATVGTYKWTNKQSAPTYEIQEISTPSDTSWEAKSISSSSGTLAVNQTITATAVNQIKYKRNKIQISKTVSSPAEKDELFKFSVDVTMPNGRHDVSIAEIRVRQGHTTGNVWISKEYSWGGKQAPTYEITEIETEDSKKYTPSITPSKGKLDGSGSVIKVNALNGSAMSYLTIEKALLDGQTTDDTFDFRVTVNGVKNTDSGTVQFEVYDVKAGEKIGPYGFEWRDANSAPTYTVEEINMNSNASVSTIEEIKNGSSRVERNTNRISGTLIKNETTNLTAVKFTNNVNKHQGNIKVIKKFFSSEKMTAEELKELANQLNVKFDVEVTLEGTFVYGGETIQNSSKVIKKTLSAENGWEFTIDNVVWYGAETPTYTVREVSLPDKWVCRSIDYNYTENESTDTPGHNLLDGGTVEVTIVNEIPSDTEIDLTFEMSGIVWVDGILDQKNDDKYYNSPNGVYDEGEPLKENAEVTIYKVIYDGSGNVVERKVATAYQDDQGNEITFPIITKSDGKWDVPRIGVPGVEQEGYSASYDVEFAYDGQTYETTTFLASGNADSFRNATTAGKKAYENNSMAIEVSNNSKNIKEVSGKTAINANGDTTGYVGLTDGSQAEISYSSANAGTAYPTVSRLNTSNPYDGRVLDLFKATATTSAGGLTFPFDVNGYDGSALTAVNKTIDDTGFHTKYKFLAVYNYCLHINLGLKEREVVDVGLTKNLTEAKVVVNERMYQYKYSGLYDLTEQKLGSLSKDIYVGNNTEEIKYTLGLYQSDYYYRAEMYKNSPDLYDRLEDFYATLNKDLNDTELDIYLTYKIKLQNSSPIYDVQINRLDDYYDSSFTLIKQDQTKYLKTQIVGGKESDVNKEIVVANTSDYADKWNTEVKTGISGSDMDGNGNNIIYNKMTANDLGIVLGPNEEKTLTLTFKVNKDKDTESGHEIENSIILGQKCNVAEIASYSVFGQGTRNYAGRIDRDSAPSNVNLPVYNTKPWYEDDTFGAPRIKINLVGDGVDRNINGVAWEDNSNGDDKSNQENPGYNQYIGNGKKDSGEKEIEGLTTNLVQKVPVQNQDGTYTEYEHIWPTGESLDCLNGATLEEITGFDTTITTGEKGKYKFQNIIAGDYVVRFIYGDKRIDSADYSTAEAYNGQDYKSAKFNGKLEDGENLQADSYLDINTYLNVKEDDERVNIAIDNEIQRLKVVQKSREITYNNSSIMANFNENSDLYKDYTMFADTPKIDMNVELPTFKHEDNGKGEVNQDYTYTVKNVDFAVEERPITELTLDQQIEEIILTTSDGNNIMDAKYSIDYEIDENGKITAKVELDSANSYGIDNLQALNRDQATTHGFRYISIDTSILEGTTITVKYRFTVLNAGEVDRTGELANMMYAEDNTKFPETIQNLATTFATYRKDGNSLKNDTALGRYLGNIYYYGANGNESDAVVTSTLRQVVDYVDNNVVFSGNLNNFENSSWSNITTQDLKGHIDPNIIQNNMIIDSKGIQYETQNRNNLIVSVDSTESTLNNKGFIIELQPYVAATQNNANYKASMNLTVTKYVGSDSDDLQIDNVAEIIKYNNKVGRRDELSIAGNQNPATAFKKTVNLATGETVSAGMEYQRDTSASEMITLSPPFGSGLATWKLQIIGTIAVALSVVAGGIVVIKKKILK